MTDFNDYIIPIEWSHDISPCLAHMTVRMYMSSLRNDVSTSTLVHHRNLC